MYSTQSRSGGYAMFADAVERAMKFTRPVIISRQTIGGDLSAGIGAFVVVNRDGWIVTAGHILEQIVGMHNEVTALRAVESERAAIDADVNLGSGEKRRRKAQLQKFSPKTTNRYSPNWCWFNVQLHNMVAIPGVDIGIGQLQPFDPNWIEEYPEFKNTATEFRLGTSLCRVGFPFHEFKPTFDGAQNRFILPPEALPIPTFVGEGIISRLMNVQVAGAPQPPPFPMKWFETSSPGLRGQSGGPLIDARGVIWGIQNNTFHYPLGFSPKAKHEGKEHTEHQFLNVGRAVHAETIFGFFRQHGVNFQIAA